MEAVVNLRFVWSRSIHDRHGYCLLFAMLLHKTVHTFFSIDLPPSLPLAVLRFLSFSSCSNKNKYSQFAAEIGLWPVGMCKRSVIIFYLLFILFGIGTTTSERPIKRLKNELIACALCNGSRRPWRFDTFDLCNSFSTFSYDCHCHSNCLFAFIGGQLTHDEWWMESGNANYNETS